MIFSPPRKRTRDVEDEDDFDLSAEHLGKRPRAYIETHSSVSFPSSTMPSRPWLIPQPTRTFSYHADTTDTDSLTSAVSEAGSMTDDSMDLDLGPSSLDTPQAPPLSSSWSGPSTWASRADRSLRRADSLISRPVRPKPYPIQSSYDQRGPPTAILHQFSSRSTIRAAPTSDRPGSPLDEDEPHTPTTVAGSQLSLLSVNDMDIDSDVATPGALVSTPLRSAVPAGSSSSDTESLAVGSFIRKQRQRSGAFISSPSDAAKRFQMGYRDDCDKCRDRVPGHMNHFLGA